jgi:hypothetical protein
LRGVPQTLDQFRRVPRITKADRDERDLLVLPVWKTGVSTNDTIGRLSGMTYSSVSHIVKSVRLRMEQDDNLKPQLSVNKTENDHNIFTIQYLTPLLSVPAGRAAADSDAADTSG